MVVVVGMLGGFVGAAAAVGADDGCEGAGGDGEEDFEGEGEVADEGVAVLGGVDACGADGEADDAGEGAAFYCCAGGVVSLDGSFVEELYCVEELCWGAWWCTYL